MTKNVKESPGKPYEWCRWMAVEKSSLSRGQVSITWLNKYSGILLRSPHVGVLVDPVEVDESMLTEVDAILITHEHYDHLDEGTVIDLQSKHNCQVICDKASYDGLSSAIPSNRLSVANVKDEFQVKDAVITAEKSSHPAEAPLTYLITSEDGVTLYHTSDSLPFKEMADIGRKHDVDVCLCTVGIAPKTSPKTGAEIASLVGPELAIPYHGEAQKEFVAILVRSSPKIRSQIIKRGEPFTYPGKGA